MRKVILTPRFKRTLEKDITTNEEVVVLLNIGTHDEVY